MAVLGGRTGEKRGEGKGKGQLLNQAFHFWRLLTCLMLFVQASLSSADIDKERRGGRGEKKGRKDLQFRPSAQIAHNPRVTHDPPSALWLSRAGPPKCGKKKKEKKKEGEGEKKTGDEIVVMQIWMLHIGVVGRVAKGKRGKKKKGKKGGARLDCTVASLLAARAALGAVTRKRERNQRRKKGEGREKKKRRGLILSYYFDHIYQFLLCHRYPRVLGDWCL